MIHITHQKDLDQIDRSLIALDIETTGLDAKRDTILGIAIADHKNTYYIEPELLPHLEMFLPTTKVLHNFKFDYRFLAAKGLSLNNSKTEDTLVMSHLIDENGDHSLEAVASQYLKLDLSYKSVFWKKYKLAQNAPKEELMKYACEDVLLTYRLYPILLEYIYLSNKKDLYNHVMRLSNSLLATEVEGVRIDNEYIISLGSKLQERIQKNVIEMRRTTNGYCNQWEMNTWVKEIEKRKTDKGKSAVERPTFSFTSSQQLGVLLYDIMGLPEQFSKTRKRTVDDAALERLEAYHPVVPLVRDYREANKIYGTYIEGILNRAIGDTIYPTFNTCGTVTGRISHQDPNMGNMPRSGGIRGIFIPRSGFTFISADYSQLEICMAAHFSGDAVLIDAIHQGVSMHDITAKALNIDRQTAKTLNFGILYGASKYKVAQIFKCKDDEAEEIIRKFFETYKGLKSIIDDCHKAVEENRDIVSPFGRTRNFRGQYENRRELERCKRQAFNSLLQGTGGDLTSRAFYLTNDSLVDSGIGRGLFTVHDEIIIEVALGSVEAGASILRDKMLQVGREIGLRVPLSVDVSEAMDRWED